MMKVLITSNSFGRGNSEAIDLLSQAKIEIIRNPYGRLMTEDELMNHIVDVDGVILGTEKFNRRIIDHASKLKVVSRYGVGIDNVDVEYLKSKGIELNITRNANSDAVADHAVGLMLSVAHNICSADRSIRNKKWKKSTSLDLYEKTIGVIGLGSIGKKVAERVQGFRCKVLAYDKYFDDKFVETNNIVKADIETIISQSDFITLHLPNLPEFHEFINADAFSKMKETAILINTARAELVEHKALYKALENRQIAGYGCDVFVAEPQIDEKLIMFENTVMTPHMGAVTKGSIDAMSRIAAENIVSGLSKFRL